MCYTRDESKRLLLDTITTLYSNSSAVISLMIVPRGKMCSSAEPPYSCKSVFSSSQPGLITTRG